MPFDHASGVLEYEQSLIWLLGVVVGAAFVRLRDGAGG